MRPRLANPCPSSSINKKWHQTSLLDHRIGEALEKPKETVQKMKHVRLLKYWVPTNWSTGPRPILNWGENDIGKQRMFVPLWYFGDCTLGTTLITLRHYLNLL